MKIMILANKDIASNYALNLLLPALNQHELCLFLSAKVGGNAKKSSQLKSLMFFEQSLFTQIISPLINHSKPHSAYKTFEQLEQYLSQPVQELNAINSQEGIEKIKTFQPDLILSIRYGNILKDEVLQIPKQGVLNLHSGLLPAYRGVMATFWAMLNDEKEIGTSLHFIDDSNIDTGRIVSHSRFKVNTQKSYFWHTLQLYESGVELIKSAIVSIEKDQPLITYPQPNSGQYFSFPEDKDLYDFEHKGLSLVNEHEIVDFIRSHYYQDALPKLADAALSNWNNK